MLNIKHVFIFVQSVTQGSQKAKVVDQNRFWLLGQTKGHWSKARRHRSGVRALQWNSRDLVEGSVDVSKIPNLGTLWFSLGPKVLTCGCGASRLDVEVYKEQLESMPGHQRKTVDCLESGKSLMPRSKAIALGKQLASENIQEETGVSGKFGSIHLEFLNQVWGEVGSLGGLKSHSSKIG